MRLASFRCRGESGFGLVEGDELLVVDPQPDTGLNGVKDLLALTPDRLRALGDGRTRKALADVELLPPITDPAVIVGIGLNTRSHFEETAVVMNRKPGDYPKYPRLFTRTSDSHVGQGGADPNPKSVAESRL